MTLVIATGGIDISVVQWSPSRGDRRYPGGPLPRPAPPVLLLPLIAAALCGAFNGLLISGFGIQPIHRHPHPDGDGTGLGS